MSEFGGLQLLPRPAYIATSILMLGTENYLEFDHFLLCSTTFLFLTFVFFINGEIEDTYDQCALNYTHKHVRFCFWWRGTKLHLYFYFHKFSNEEMLITVEKHII